MSESIGTVVDAGYAKFCSCGSELFPSDGVSTCEKGHHWRSRVETFEFYPHGPKYQAHKGERVVWERIAEIDGAWAWDD